MPNYLFQCPAPSRNCSLCSQEGSDKCAFVNADIALQVELTHKMMLHWEKLLPDRIMRVSYDALVRDQKATSKQLLKFCGLIWDPAVVQFHRTKRDVSTASQSQVSLL